MCLSQCFLFSFAFLQIEPKYVCTYPGSTEAVTCSRLDFCGNSSVGWNYDWRDSETIDNLIMQFDMECEDPILLGLIGSCFLLGIVIGSVTLTRIGDVFGRRQGFMIGLAVQSTATICVLLTSNYYTACFLCFVIGFGVTGKQYVGWNYLLEMQPKNMQDKVGTLEFIMEAAVYIAVTIYFGWINKHWHFIQIPTITFGVVGIIFLYLQPESPRYLVSVGRFEQARQSFTFIARFNG